MTWPSPSSALEQAWREAKGGGRETTPLIIAVAALVGCGKNEAQEKDNNGKGNKKAATKEEGSKITPPLAETHAHFHLAHALGHAAYRQDIALFKVLRCGNRLVVQERFIRGRGIG